MQSSHSDFVLVMERGSKPGHLDALIPILEQADVEVLTADTPDHVTRERTPSAIILSLDQQTLSKDLGTAGLVGWLTPDKIEVPIIVAASDLDASQICSLLELGVTDFINPPFTAASVLPRIWRIAGHRSGPAGAKESVLEKLSMRNLSLLGESPSFLDEIKKLPTLARCDVTVMISGETGTGKELIARALHYLSHRQDQPFVPVDCGAIPADLAESELFGHERGAFTGAVMRNPGLVSAANHGTFFLDEVDALTLSVQAKLLRFLQQMEYRRLGSSEIKRSDVRVISATNGDLVQRVRNGEFREDLFYRLNVVHLKLPSLRQRSEDVVLLARHFATKYSRSFKRPGREFSPGALSKLLMHKWPGNIRELENVVEAAVALCEGPLIRASDLAFAGTGPRPPASFREAKAQMISEFERDYVVRLLCAWGGNVSQAARAAGKNRRAFWELVRKYRIDVRELKNARLGAEKRKPSARAARAGARGSSSE